MEQVLPLYENDLFETPSILVRNPKELLSLSLNEFHLGPAHCLQNTIVERKRGLILPLGTFRKSVSSWFYKEFCKKVRVAWTQLRSLNVSQCSYLDLEQILFCRNFLFGRGNSQDEEEEGSIRKYWKANESDILASLDNLMDSIEEMVEENEPKEASQALHQETIPQEDHLNYYLCSPSRRRNKRRRLSNDITTAAAATAAAAAAAVHDDPITSHANNKMTEEIFKAYQAEVKMKEEVQEELRICKKQLANLERAIYPRSLFEKDFDHYGKRYCSSASQYGSYLLKTKGIAQMIESATSTYRNGFKTDVENFFRGFYGTYSGRVHNQAPRVFSIYSDDYNDLAEVCGLCLMLNYFNQPFDYYAPGSKVPSKCPFLP
jgi:hypothetical protein